MNNTTIVLPQLFIFTFDYILVPFNVVNVNLPLTKLDSGKVIDDGDIQIKHYPQVPIVFDTIKSNRMTIAVSFEPDAKEKALQLIDIFDWEKFITFEEIYTGNITEHLKNLSKKSKVPFNKMILFDKERRNIKAALRLGVYSVQVFPVRGMRMEVLKRAFKDFKLNQRKKLLLQIQYNFTTSSPVANR